MEHANNTDDQSDVAKAMGNYLAKWKLGLDGMLMLGDNLYGEMPGGVASSRWQSSFEGVHPKITFDCPAYAVAGNHDY